MKRKRKQKRPANVVDIGPRQAEKLVEKIQELTRDLASAQDEQVAQVLAAYRQWEEENPDAAVRPDVKLLMVRLGFIGTGGFERCHEEHRLPVNAYWKEDEFASELHYDSVGSEWLMCPAMESRECQRIWREMRAPPCHLLLLEVHQGLGGHIYDDRISEILSDYGGLREEDYSASFVRAEKLLRRHR